MFVRRLGLRCRESVRWGAEPPPKVQASRQKSADNACSNQADRTGRQAAARACSIGECVQSRKAEPGTERPKTSSAKLLKATGGEESKRKQFSCTSAWRKLSWGIAGSRVSLPAEGEKRIGNTDLRRRMAAQTRPAALENDSG